MTLKTYWIIDRDIVQKGLLDDAKSANYPWVAFTYGKAYHFRLFNAAGEVCYEGRSSNPDTTPMHEFGEALKGEPDTECVSIKYYTPEEA